VTATGNPIANAVPRHESDEERDADGKRENGKFAQAPPRALKKRQQGTSDPISVYWYLSSDPNPATLIFKSGQ